LKLDPFGMLGSGSLLVTAAPEAVPALIAAAGQQGIGVTVIGQILQPDDGIQADDAGSMVELPTFDTDEVSRALNEHRSRIGGNSAT
jgi:hydrogenase expression/formation protein HypE